MPLLMSTTFAPGEDGDYLLFTQDHGENQKEIARHSKHDADAYDQYSHDMEMVCQAIKPLMDMVPPDIFSDDPEELIALASLGLALQEARQAGAAQRGPAADRQRGGLPRRLLRGPAPQGLPRLVEHHRHQGRVRARRAPASCCCTTRSASTTASSARGPSTRRATAGSPRSSSARPESFGAEVILESPVDSVITKDGRATGVALKDGTEYYADTVVSALDPRRTFLELVEPARAARRPRREHPALPLPGHVIEGQLRARRAAPVRRPRRQPVPRLHQHRALDGLPRARLRRREVRLVQPEPVHRHGRPVDHRCRHGASRQARHVVLHPVHAVPPARERLGHREGEPGRHRPADPRAVLPGLRRTSSSSARSSRRSHIERTVGLSEGNIFAGEFFAPQMFFFRPAPGWSQYRTPIDGYYQCGSGTHPGGCVMGAPGKLAAGQILKDRAKDQGPRLGPSRVQTQTNGGPPSAGRRRRASGSAT